MSFDTDVSLVAVLKIVICLLQCVSLGFSVMVSTLCKTDRLLLEGC